MLVNSENNSNEKIKLADLPPLSEERQRRKEELKQFVTQKENKTNLFIKQAVEATVQKVQENKPKIRLFDRTELGQIQSPGWLVANHIPAKSLGCIYGPYGSYKSFLALDIALCIANGLNYLGKHDTKPGKVIYLAAEGHWEIRKRIEAWESFMGKTTPQGVFGLIPDAMNLMEEDSAVLLNQIVNGKYAGISIVVVDTLARNFGDGDENSTKDMNKIIRTASEIQKQLDCAVGFIHHTGKDTGKKSRGSTSLGGAMDWMIETTKADEQLIVKCEKQKDYKPFATYTMDVKEHLDSLVLQFGHYGDKATHAKEQSSQQDESAVFALLPEDANYISSTDIDQKLNWNNKKKLIEVLKRLEKQNKVNLLTTPEHSKKPWQARRAYLGA